MTRIQTMVSSERIESSIFFVRGQRVMLDADLAEIYGVETAALNRAMKRNRKRFPPDFMFQLNAQEYENLKGQFGASSWGGRRYPPFAFTEHGAVMLASVLNSSRAIRASIQVVRAFVRLRHFLATHKDLARKLAVLERKLESHDGHFKVIYDAIRELMAPKRPPKRIGF